VREFEARPTEVVALLDARLTELGEPETINPAGGEAGIGSATLVYDVAAFGAVTEVQLVSLSEQGLAKPLPLGWRLLWAVDITPELLTTSAVTLQIPASALVSDTSFAPVIAAAWDEPRDRVAPHGRDPARRLDHARSLAHGPIRSGQGRPGAPAAAAPEVGDLLAGVPAGALDAGATAEVLPRPAIILINTGSGTSEVSIRLATGPMPSGSAIRATISDRYQLATGGELVASGLEEDILVYQRPGSIEARFSVARCPSLPASSWTAPSRSPRAPRPGDAVQGAGLIGAAGGSVATVAGTVLTIPASATTEPTVIQAQDETGDPSLTTSLFRHLATVSIALPADLATGATLAVQYPGGLDPARRCCWFIRSRWKTGPSTPWSA